MRIIAVSLAVSTLLLVSGCGSDEDEKTTATETDIVDDMTDTSSASFSLSSSSFDSGGAIPEDLACEDEGGSDISPQLSWSSSPAGTASYAIVMDDEIPPCGSGDDACMHWSVLNIPADVTSLAEGEDVTTIAGVATGRNYTGANGYAGPCPPEAHIYKITVFALGADAPVIMDGEAVTRGSFEKDNAQFILGSDTIQGTFTP
jgi:hypothetical protein